MNPEEEVRRLQEAMLLNTIDSLKALVESLEEKLSQQKEFFRADNESILESTTKKELREAREEITQLKLQQQEITGFIKENEQLKKELAKLRSELTKIGCETLSKMI